MNENLIWYRFIIKWLSPTLCFIADFFKQLVIIVKERSKNIKELFNEFLRDIKSLKSARSWAALFALTIILIWAVYLPGRDTFLWTRHQYIRWILTKSEWVPKDETTTWTSVVAFTDAYSTAYGTDCEWFRLHTADLLMWTDYGRLRNPNYSCPAFKKYAGTKLFPISVSSPMRNKDVLTLDTLLGRVDYNQQGAERYTTVRTSLWKRVGDIEWRINHMNNVQKWEFN